MRDICFAYAITTKVPGMKCVLVIEKDGRVEQRVPYNGEEGQTIVFLYDKESRIIWESQEGRYYTDSIPYETKRLFYEPHFVEMCRKYGAAVGRWKEETPKEEVTFENLERKGLNFFDEREVFRLCSRRIREENYEEDEFLTYLCIELFRRGQYDKTTLLYLSDYYYGATADMKRLWKALREYGIPRTNWERGSSRRWSLLRICLERRRSSRITTCPEMCISGSGRPIWPLSPGNSGAGEKAGSLYL